MTNKPTDKQGFNRQVHWQHVYSERSSADVSWYQQYPERSLELIKVAGADVSSQIIDIGAGASTLVDCMLDEGFKSVSVLDISHAAIEQAKARLGDRANKVEWFEEDITEFSPGRTYDVWHDRAVFHFLTDVLDRSAYVHAMSRALKPGANAIIATFALNGPEKCSGLDVVRYSPDSMAAVLGDSFELVETDTEEHVTPDGELQNFVYCRFLKVIQ